MRRPPRDLHLLADYERPAFNAAGQIVGHVWDCTLEYQGRTLSLCVRSFNRAAPRLTYILDLLVARARESTRCDDNLWDVGDLPIDTSLALQALLGDDLYDRVIDEWEGALL